MIYSSPHVYSFGKRTQGTDAYFINKNSKLGPGQYNIKTKNGNKQTPQQYSFGKSKTPKYTVIKQITPGPGEYNNENMNSFGKHFPQYTISKSNRESLFDISKHKPTTNDIGPGYYNTINKKGKGFSMGKPPSARVIKVTPGPGEYEQKEYFGKKGIKYTGVQQHDKKESIFSQTSRSSYTPGPGSYNTISSFDRPKSGCIIRGKPLYSSNTNTPGPGEYNINEASKKTQKKRGPEYKVGSERRRFFNINETNPGIGPGYYNYKPNNKKGCVFSKERKFNVKDNKTPGPGSYKIPCGMVHVPLYTEDKFDPDFKYV